MTLFHTHLTVLEQTATRSPLAPAFRLPRLGPNSDKVLEWDTVTYQQFWQDVETFARCWTRSLSADGVARRSVVGLWLGGVTYLDAVHIYAIARAGYIPQYFSLRLPNPDIIFELLEKSNGRALIYDASYASPVLNDHPLPTYSAVDARTLPDALEVALPPNVASTNANDTLMIFHTSGSTSGRPKLVPVSYRWWDCMLSKINRHMRPRSSRDGRQDVTVWMGSMCHFGQSFMLAGMIQHASCTVQFTQQGFSSDELVDMIQRCGLSRINIFPTFLAQHLRNSRHNPKLLAYLQSLDQILISGLMMSPEDEEWVYTNGIKLLNCYGNTEVGSMLVTPDEDLETGSIDAMHSLTPVRGSHFAFVPIDDPEEADPTVDEAAYANANAQLLELIVLADSPDCPDPSLRHADGDYHTGDLFLCTGPGRYVYRGRNDDWIKSENSLRCDTKAIEDNVLASCADLVAAAIVVGSGRPSPALFVEPKSPAADRERLRRDVVRRIRPFHTRRYMHERIVSPQFVFVVDPGTLPRTATKGNIRRRAVEDQFKAQLDQLYGGAVAAR
ncbi:acetyl-CoA synthetase-like protein [Epithele typhae]|uniref:acetyl-CoA synthetase-like protein n=1 Tax=Epithele typhae TaxID=378194 RepID=UPI002007C430|nr:acetyl-CoA synthetase-like protein [Epithele typhae]KAH9944105.1 acetyl-CoA synthetase-like protein [Epithele typhae]